MVANSFGVGYADIDRAGVPELLEYLDGLAEICAVGDAKRGASAALALRPGHRVLDVGCGTGVDLLDLAKRVTPGGTVFGLDPSASALRAAHRRVAGHDGIALVRAAVEQLPFDDEVLDACRADRTLQHISEPEQALEEVRRVLRPGGRFVVLEMVISLDADATDHALAMHVTERLWSTKSEAWLPYMLPLLLNRAGFAEVEIAQTKVASASLSEADLALRLRASLEDAIAAGAVERPRVEGWLEDLRAAEQRGAPALHMQFVRISAVAA